MSHDTLIHQLVRPPVRAVARIGVTPNQLTTLRLATGLAAAAAFCAPAFTPRAGAWLAGGAAVMLLSLLLDRADGELARHTGKSSQGGYRYDLACDFVCTVAAFAGLGVGAIPTMGWLAVLLGVAAGVSIVALFYLLNVAKVSTARGVSAGGRVLVDPDDAMVLVPVMIWLGWAQIVLAIAGTLTPAVALVVLARAGMRRFKRD